MKAFFRLVLLALVLLVVALVLALTAMRLAIHGHEVAVPDLVGKSPAAAKMIAEQSGLELSVERQYYSPTVPEGKILSQLPPARSQVRRGWQVRVAESLGPQRVEIPNLLGQSERVANINIRRRGLDVGSIAQMRLPDAAEGQVLAQFYRATAGQRHAGVAGRRTATGNGNTRSVPGKHGDDDASAASSGPVAHQHGGLAKSRCGRKSGHGGNGESRGSVAPAHWAGETPAGQLAGRRRYGPSLSVYMN